MIELPTDDDPVKVIQGDSEAMAADLLDVADAIVSDPPYGMNWDTDCRRFSGGKFADTRGKARGDWPEIHGDAEPFDPLPWLACPKVVLWGANHYAASLPVGTTLVWLKKADHLFGTFLSDAEVGWMKGGHGVYCFRKQFPPPSRMAEGNGRCLHPTQKPVDLMRWAIRKLKMPPGSLIVDPYAGSGTTAVAASKEGHRCLLIEKEPAYVRIIRDRLSEKGTLFATTEVA